jgi:hypothetical protein
MGADTNVASFSASNLWGSSSRRINIHFLLACPQKVGCERIVQSNEDMISNVNLEIPSTFSVSLEYSRVFEARRPASLIGQFRFVIKNQKREKREC